MRQYTMKNKGSDNQPAWVALTDEGVMPFGKHKGEKMKGVPASYLLWLYDNDERGLWQGCGIHAMPVKMYIEANIAAIEKDAPDYIMAHDPRRKKK